MDGCSIGVVVSADLVVGICWNDYVVLLCMSVDVAVGMCVYVDLGVSMSVSVCGGLVYVAELCYLLSFYV